jgi:hypothetical protein
MSAGAFTLIKAKFPAMLGKVLDWGPNGIEKTVAGDLCEGSFIVPRFNTIEQFAQLIANLTPSQVISSSLEKS